MPWMKDVENFSKLTEALKRFIVSLLNSFTVEQFDWRTNLEQEGMQWTNGLAKAKSFRTRIRKS